MQLNALYRSVTIASRLYSSHTQLNPHSSIIWVHLRLASAGLMGGCVSLSGVRQSCTVPAEWCHCTSEQCSRQCCEQKVPTLQPVGSEEDFDSYDYEAWRTLTGGRGEEEQRVSPCVVTTDLQ